MSALLELATGLDREADRYTGQLFVQRIYANGGVSQTTLRMISFLKPNSIQSFESFRPAKDYWKPFDELLTVLMQQVLPWGAVKNKKPDAVPGLLYANDEVWRVIQYRGQLFAVGSKRKSWNGCAFRIISKEQYDNLRWR